MNESNPKMADLVGSELSPKAWLLYYKNTWVKNLIARTIDVQHDVTLCKTNPEEEFMDYDDMGRPTGQKIPARMRLEKRKMSVQDALDLIAAIDALLAVVDDKEIKFEERVWSQEALKPVVYAEKKVEAEPAKEPEKTPEPANITGKQEVTPEPAK